MDLPANGSGIGQPVRRREDLRLVRGAGRYTADENLPGQVYAVMLRSPHAHARIRSIAKDAAAATPGVLAVLTGEDFRADGLQPIPHKPWSQHPMEIPLKNSDGSPIFTAGSHGETGSNAAPATGDIEFAARIYRPALWFAFDRPDGSPDRRTH